MRTRFGFLAVAATVLLTLATTAQADHLRPHEHYIVTPSGEQALIGPKVCNNPAVFEGFDTFHERVHESENFQDAIERSPGTEIVVFC